MLVRIVKMTFKRGYISDFQEIFQSGKNKIKVFDGCTFLELYQDKNNPTIFFNYCCWIDEKHLNTYRHSKLFKDVRSQTKTLFETKPEAWGVNKMEALK